MINLKEQHDQYYQDDNNLVNLRKSIDSVPNKYKIEQYCNKFKRDYTMVRNKILSDDCFADFFVPILAKRNFFESKTLKYLQTELGYPMVKMNHVGDHALYLSDGRIVSNPTINSTKSFDFKMLEKRSTTFIAHKYIHENGGAQDNQFNDLKYFLVQANKYFDADREDLFDSNIKFMAIVDGEYFTNERIGVLNTFKRKNKIMINRLNDM